jgi:hypothetical protein
MCRRPSSRGGVGEEQMAGFYAASTQLDAHDWSGENG